MKKEYKQPITEKVILNLGEQLVWGEGANGSNTNQYTEGKQFDSYFIEDPDDTDFWNTDSWDVKYDLWKE